MGCVRNVDGVRMGCVRNVDGVRMGCVRNVDGVRMGCVRNQSVSIVCSSNRFNSYTDRQTMIHLNTVQSRHQRTQLARKLHHVRKSGAKTLQATCSPYIQSNNLLKKTSNIANSTSQHLNITYWPKFKYIYSFVCPNIISLNFKKKWVFLFQITKYKNFLFGACKEKEVKRTLILQSTQQYVTQFESRLQSIAKLCY